MAENQTIPLHQQGSTYKATPAENNHSLYVRSQPNRDILCDRANFLNKISIPIKQYSNKFFRQLKPEPKEEPSQKKLNPQRRFNVIFKKKPLLRRNGRKNECQFSDQQFLFEAEVKHQTLIKVSTLANNKHEKRSKTEPFTVQSNINEIQNELLLNSVCLSNLLTPTNQHFMTSKGHFFQEHENRKRKSHTSLLTDQIKEKISQSRGLELYSKVFIRNKSQLIEKIKTHKFKSKATALNGQQLQNFEAKKITPIEKKREGLALKPRNPWRHSGKKCHTIQTVQNDEFFELKGWETIA